MKTHRLPEGTPQSGGKALVNLLPLAQGEKIATVLALPEDEGSWGEFHVMFATAKGYVRRNAMSDFVSINANGKIAMKFEGEDADDSLIGVFTCTEQDDILLARSEEHTSELQSLMRTTYYVLFLKNKKKNIYI